MLTSNTTIDQAMRHGTGPERSVHHIPLSPRRSTVMRQLTAGSRSQFVVLYRTGAGIAREVYRRLDAALLRAEFIRRVERCPVRVRRGWGR
jgi:hypothetical protein